MRGQPLLKPAASWERWHATRNHWRKSLIYVLDPFLSQNHRLSRLIEVSTLLVLTNYSQ
jgi:hypothetical protein